MLSASRLYSFLDSQHGFAVHFLDGQKLVHDLALIHPLKGAAFAYFRDTVLGFMPMISFLKPGESLGIYVDSARPYFRLKIETNQAGHTRTLLLPEDFNQFPMKLTGETRITKQFPGGRSPYTSVMQFEDMDSSQLANQIIRGSYQATAETVVSEIADQSYLVIKLPAAQVNSTLEDLTPSLPEFLARHKAFFHDICEEHYSDVKEIVAAFEKGPFTYLSSRQVGLHCPCSHDQMAHNLRLMYAADPDALFEGDAFVEAKCDYCKKTYRITRDEVTTPPTFS